MFSHAVLFQRFEAVGFFVGNQGEDSEIPAGLLEGGVIEGNVELPALHPLDDQIGVDQALRLGREELKAGKQLLSECIERSAQLRDQRFASLRIAEKVDVVAKALIFDGSDFLAVARALSLPLEREHAPHGYSGNVLVEGTGGFKRVQALSGTDRAEFNDGLPLLGVRARPFERISRVKQTPNPLSAEVRQTEVFPVVPQQEAGFRNPHRKQSPACSR